MVNARTGVVTHRDGRLSAAQVSFGEKGEIAFYIEEGGTLVEPRAAGQLTHARPQARDPAEPPAMGALRAELVIL